MKKGNALALLPIGIFLILYLGLVALLVACLQNRSLSFDEKLSLMGKGIGDKNIVTMILIFMEAGIFVGVVGRSSAESVAYFTLSLIPARYAVAVLFVVSCFVSLAMGTSVGTITLITPIAAEIAKASGFPVALCAGSVMGGAMFGDNLSFISDTTIAACNGQGCEMKDKGGIVGINVFVVLLIGILSGSMIMLFTGAIPATGLLSSMGSGAAGMFETTMVAILVSAICALIRENGGFDALLSWIYRVFRGKKGGQLGMGLLVGIMDIATANNTVAIVMANPIAAEMSGNYGISKRKAASLLDTFSCVFQGIIPYGAQMLVAISACEELGMHVSAFEIIPNLFYPFLLLIIPNHRTKE